MHERFPLPDIGWVPLREFWGAAARGVLSLPHCEGCERICWYPERCLDCGGDTFDWKAVSGRGKLFTWVVLEHAFLPQYASSLPFVAALVSLEDDERVRLATCIVDSAPGDLRIDQPVEVTFRPLRFDGVPGEVTAPLFRPAG